MKLFFALCALVYACWLACSPAVAAPAGQERSLPLRSLRDIVGVTHVAGAYCFTDKDFLNEGADQILALGSRVIKVWFTSQAAEKYPFHSTWPAVNSLVDLAKAPYYRSLFSKPFTTIILETYAPGREDHYYRSSVSAEQAARESQDFYDLTSYLLTHYKHSGKTFILQNWEGDWSLIGAGEARDPTKTEIDGMVAWLNARQEGVDRARKEVGMDGVVVANAAEVNLVERALKGRPTVASDVLPSTHCDLYSYSSWDTEYDPNEFRKALDYIASKAPPSALYGHHNIYVGEYGAPENRIGGAQRQLDLVKSATQVALQFGAPYIVYWELYCNEPLHPFSGRPTDADMSGFWLVRPDGSHSLVWNFFADLFAQK